MAVRIVELRLSIEVIEAVLCGRGTVQAQIALYLGFGLSSWRFDGSIARRICR